MRIAIPVVSIIEILLAILLAIAVMQVPTLVSAAPLSTLTICYQFPTDGNDKGFTFINNMAQREAASRIRTLYPALKLKNLVYFNQNYVPNMTSQMIKMIETHGCNAIMSCSRTLWSTLPNGSISAMSAMYPSVMFWLFSAKIALNPSNPPNVHGGTLDVWSKWFALGAAAAVECSSCVGFLIPMAPFRGLITAFNRGMQFGQQFRSDGANVSLLCPIVGIDQNTFNSPEGEQAFVRSMLHRGCSLVAIYSDNAVGAQLIQRLAPKAANGRPVFSLTGNVNGALTIGDSVLGSVINNFNGFFFRNLEAMILQQPLTSGIIPDGSVIGDVSPLAVFNASLAMNAAIAALGTNNSVLWCPPLYDQQGNLVNNGTCVLYPQYSAMNFVERGLVQYPTFQSPLNCPAGTFANYSYMTDLSLTCSYCPPGTFSSVSGAANCTACLSGSYSAAFGSTFCRQIVTPSSSNTALTIGLLAALIPCGLGVIIVAAVLIFLGEREKKRQNKIVPPPRNPTLAVCIIDVDPERSSYGWRDQILVAAYIFELFRSSVVNAAEQQDAYIVSATPTTYIIVAPTARQLVSVAEDVERALFTHPDQEVVISIRAVITVGRVICRGGHNKSSRATYSGPAIDKLLIMYQDPAVRSLLCLSDDVLDDIRETDPAILERVLEKFVVRPPPPQQGETTSADAQPLPPQPGGEEVIAVRIMFHCCVGAPPRNRGTRKQRATTAPPSTDAPDVAPPGAEPLRPPNSSSNKPKATMQAEPLVPECQQTVLRLMCSKTLIMFLNILSPSKQEYVVSQLAQRFRILLPPTATMVRVAPPAATGSQEASEMKVSSASLHRGNAVLGDIVSCIVPSVVETLDELHLREELAVMANDHAVKKRKPAFATQQ